METCDHCFKRPGKLTSQFVAGPLGIKGEIPQFVFRFYTCPWCLGAENRRRAKECKSLITYMQHIPDEELLK